MMPRASWGATTVMPPPESRFSPANRSPFDGMNCGSTRRASMIPFAEPL
jgi:hypothetical protein